MQQPHRQALPALLDEIEVDHRGAVARLDVGRRAEQRDGVAPHDIGHRERPCLEAREIDAQPLGERRVEVNDAAVRFGRQEPGRRVIEIVDGVLQVLEDRFLALALMRDVGYAPRDVGVARRRAADRLARNAVPAGAGPFGCVEGRRNTHLFLGRDTTADPLRDPVDRLGRLGVSGKDPLHRMHVAGVGGADHVGVGPVGVDDPPGPVGQQHAFADAIDEGLADAVIAAPSRKSQQADGGAEQRSDAHHREHAEKSEQKWLAAAGFDQHEADRDADQPERENDEATDAVDALGPVDDRRGAGGRCAIAHG